MLNTTFILISNEKWCALVENPKPLSSNRVKISFFVVVVHYFARLPNQSCRTNGLQSCMYLRQNQGHQQVQQVLSHHSSLLHQLENKKKVRIIYICPIEFEKLIFKLSRIIIFSVAVLLFLCTCSYKKCIFFYYRGNSEQI